MHKLGAVALTPGERFAKGKEYRKRVRRAAHGECKASKPGPDVVQTLRASARGRLRDLMPIKMARMAASPFGFFRGAAPLMAADLGSLPHCGLEVTICVEG